LAAARGGSPAAPVLMLSPLFVQNVTFPWTKLPAAFFRARGRAAAVRNLREPTGHWHLGLAAALLAAAVLTHYSSAVWAVALGAGWAFSGWRSGSLVRSARNLPCCRPDRRVGVGHVVRLGFGPLRERAPRWARTVSVATAQRLSAGDALLIGTRNLINTIVPHPLLGTGEPVLLQSNRLAVVTDWFSISIRRPCPSLGRCGAGIARADVRRPGPPVGERIFWWSALLLAGLLGVITHTQPSPGA